MYCADYVVVKDMNKSFVFQTFQDIIDGRRAGMQYRSQAAFRAVPPFSLQYLGGGKSVYVRIYSGLGQLKMHLLEHPRLNYKIKRFCHNI